MRHLKSWPLRPVEGVIHEWLGLVMAQHGEMVHVVSDGSPLDGSPPMGSGMHPAAVVRFHLQSVDESPNPPDGFEVFDEAVLINPPGQRHDFGWIAKSCQSLKIGEQLRMKRLIGNPADLRTLHGVPKADSGFVLP